MRSGQLAFCERNGSVYHLTCAGEIRGVGELQLTEPTRSDEISHEEAVEWMEANGHEKNFKLIFGE